MKTRGQVIGSLICLLVFCCGAMAAGCASLKEGLKGFAGISTKVLEDNRPSALRKTFKYDYATSYQRTSSVLEKMGVYIYKKDPHLVAFYVSETNTTPVGIFFDRASDATTTVEISSPSTYAKELVASKVFSDIEVSIELEKVSNVIQGNK